MRFGFPFLPVTAQGCPTPADLWGLVETIGRVLGQQDQRSVILNLQDMKLPASFTTHRQFLVHAASKLSRLEGVAVVCERNSLQISEVVAQSLGLKLRVFSDRNEAVAWVQAGHFPVARLAAIELACGFAPS